jgi:hypothetical protein
MEQGIRTAPDMLAHLKKNNFYGEDAFTVRTVGYRMADCRRLDDTQPWSPFENDDENTLEDAQRILPVLRWLAGESWGQMWISRAVAWWVGRVCAIADPAPDWAWAFAKAYQWASGRKETDTRCLDLALMFRIWDMACVTGSSDLTNAENYLRAVKANADRFRMLQSCCQQASPTTWEAQWSDLLAFQAWVSSFDSLPPWAEDEKEPLESRTSSI